jgi:hypothetical protein
VHVRLRVQLADSTVRVRLLAAKSLLGGAVKRHASAATLSLKVPLNRRGRAALRHTGRLRLSVRVTVKAPGQSPITASRRVMLRR